MLLEKSTFEGYFMEDKILKQLGSSVVSERIKKIRSIYNKLEKKQQKFCDDFDIHCAKGCGTCCEHFTPDISEAEAEFLAYGLIKEGKDEFVYELLMNKEENDKYCPLYIKDSEFHCSVYKWRPLICRLFGATASKNKNGECVFRKCKYNSIGHDVCSCEFAKNSKAVVLMSDYGEMINEIDPNSQTKELINKALPKAIDKVRYMLELERNDSNERD